MGKQLNQTKFTLNVAFMFVSIIWVLFNYFTPDFISIENWKAIITIGFILHLLTPIAMIDIYLALVKSIQWKEVITKKTKIIFQVMYFTLIVTSIFFFSPLEEYRDLIHGPLFYNGPCWASGEVLTFDALNPRANIIIYNNNDGDKRFGTLVQVKQKDIHKVLKPKNYIEAILTQGECYRSVSMIYLPNTKVSLEVK